MAGCQTEGEDINHGYIQVSATIVYPEEININSYRVTYNGKDIYNSFFTPEEKEGELQIFSKDAGELELSTKLILKDGRNNIELIKLPGKTIELYDEANYISFRTTLALYDGVGLSQNGQPLISGLNYIAKDKATGDLTFYKEGESEPLHVIENTTIEQDANLIFMQSGETEFVTLTDDSEGEEAPASENLSKIRFFYAPVGGLNHDAIEVELISYDYYSVSAIDYITPSVIVEKGKLSSYVELDIAKYKDTYFSPAGFGYSIYAYDVATQTRGILIEDVMNGNNMFNLDAQSDDQYKTKYKFATYQITIRSGYPPLFILGTEW